MGQENVVAGALLLHILARIYIQSSREHYKRSKEQVRDEAILRQIAGIGPFIEGTLVKLPRKDCRHVAHRLTSKVEGKTRAVYVPPQKGRRRIRDLSLDPNCQYEGQGRMELVGEMSITFDIRFRTDASCRVVDYTDTTPGEPMPDEVEIVSLKNHTTNNDIL